MRKDKVYSFGLHPEVHANILHQLLVRMKKEISVSGFTWKMDVRPVFVAVYVCSLR